jgi:hypothetical protein
VRIQGTAADASRERAAPAGAAGAAPRRFADRLDAAGPRRPATAAGDRRRVAGGGGRAGGAAAGGAAAGEDRVARAGLDAEAARTGAGPGGFPCGGPGVAAASRARAAGTPLLARAIERLALAVDLGGEPALTVRLGESLAVTLTQRPTGVEVRLAAARGLSPAAEAELPLLVAALRARGVRVVGADVRRIPAPRARRPAGEDVDRGEGLR